MKGIITLTQGIYDRDRFFAIAKATQFKLKATGPRSWKYNSLVLKHAADRLYGLSHDAYLRDLQRTIDEMEKGIRGAGDLEGQELEDWWDMSLGSIYYLLLGYSIENLLKAMVLLKEPGHFKEAEGKVDGIKSHDLRTLCEDRCAVTLQDSEGALLEKLTSYIVWQGKYPIPLKLADCFPKKQADGAWIDGGWSPVTLEREKEEIDNLFEKIWRELDSLYKTNP